MAFDISRVRADFPILKSGITYLDSAASALTPEPVVQKMDEYYHEYRANIHRGAHRLTKRASEEYEAVYPKLAKFFNAPSGKFVNALNTTAAINLVALGLDFSPKQNIVTTNIEHHSNLLPWVRLEKQKRISGLRIVEPQDREGHFDIDSFAQAIDADTRLVAVTASSNVLGNIMPLQEIIKVGHESGALVLVDAAQAVGHRKFDFKSLGADYVAFSGHKMMGPTGTGALYVAEGAEFESPIVGGGTITDADLHDYKLLPLPESMEAGTPNIAGFIGLGATIDYLSALGVDNIHSHERGLVSRMLAGMLNLGLEVYGPKDSSQKAGVVAFNVPKIDAHQTALMADQLGRVCIRSGHHCALPVSRMLGIRASARASVHAFNDESDISRLLDALSKIKAIA